MNLSEEERTEFYRGQITSPSVNLNHAPSVKGFGFNLVLEILDIFFPFTVLAIRVLVLFFFACLISLCYYELITRCAQDKYLFVCLHVTSSHLLYEMLYWVLH